MGEKNGQPDEVIEVLSPEEQKALANSLKTVEAQIVARVVKRLSVWISLAVSILLIGGLINLSSCYSNVENSVTQKLTNDPELRDKVISKVQQRFNETDKRLNELKEQTALFEKENARAAATFVNDLEQIRIMVEQINTELSRRSDIGVNKRRATQNVNGRK